MWPSLATANHIADIANWFFIGSLVVGAVSTILIVWMAGVKEGYWEQDRRESGERIAGLATQGDQLRKDTAEANARAAEAQLALERYKAPRELTGDQQARIITALRKFAGQEYGITTFWDLKEPLAFAESLNKLFQIAGWKFFSDGKRGFILGGLSGVQISMHPDADTPVKEAVAALTGILKAEELEPTIKLQNPQNNPKHNRIFLNVGTKQ
jgi:hypothetical protein